MDSNEHRAAVKAPKGFFGSIRWIVARNQWTFVLSLIALITVAFLMAIDAGVPDNTGNVMTVLDQIGIGFFIARVSVVTLLLAVWVSAAKKIVVRITRSCEAGQAVADHRFRILFYYLLIELVLFAL